MKGKTLYLIICCLIALSLAFAGCSSPATDGPESKLTDEQYEQLEKEFTERGICNTETAAAASRVAGFPVATPAFIPEGIRLASKYMITDHHAGLRA